MPGVSKLLALAKIAKGIFPENVIECLLDMVEMISAGSDMTFLMRESFVW